MATRKTSSKKKSAAPKKVSARKTTTASPKKSAKKAVAGKTKRGTARKTSKRTLIEPHPGDKRYVRRNKKGEFKTQVDVGRSLAADRRRKSKTKAAKGQGDRGDTGGGGLSGFVGRILDKF